MALLTRSLAAVAATLGLTLAAGTAHAAPPPNPGTVCGPGKVVTDNHSCSGINKSCTGYDGMIIGRVDHWGHCVFPGVNGTTW
ncbi:hypothetical protein [Tsukamurella soli]|uniref:DUF2282 domain-containing protein n=1 Tax=Tsukamurella soli TaxID=644556 RepID=A0ABP8JDY9_9ACTN